MNADLHHLSGAYAVDALDDAERTAFEQHLAGCTDCRAEVAELSAAAHSLGALTEATPPPSLRASVLSGISQVRPLPPLPADAGAPSPRTVTSGGPDTTTPSEDFVIDGADGLTLVSACSGHGAKFAPVIGEVAADVATGAPGLDRFRL